jgi:hypothetical protein
MGCLNHFEPSVQKDQDPENLELHRPLSETMMEEDDICYRHEPVPVSSTTTFIAPNLPPVIIQEQTTIQQAIVQMCTLSGDVFDRSSQSRSSSMREFCSAAYRRSRDGHISSSSSPAYQYHSTMSLDSRDSSLFAQVTGMDYRNGSVKSDELHRDRSIRSTKVVQYDLMTGFRASQSSPGYGVTSQERTEHRYDSSDLIVEVHHNFRESGRLRCYYDDAHQRRRRFENYRTSNAIGCELGCSCENIREPGMGHVEQLRGYHT